MERVGMDPGWCSRGTRVKRGWDAGLCDATQSAIHASVRCRALGCQSFLPPWFLVSLSMIRLLRPFFPSLLQESLGRSWVPSSPLQVGVDVVETYNAERVAEKSTNGGRVEAGVWCPQSHPMYGYESATQLRLELLPNRHVF